MCWCNPEMKMMYCGKGPCSENYIREFQSIATELCPNLQGTSLLKELTESYAKDMAGWKRNQEMLLNIQHIALAQRLRLENMILDVLNKNFPLTSNHEK